MFRDIFVFEKLWAKRATKIPGPVRTLPWFSPGSGTASCRRELWNVQCSTGILKVGTKDANYLAVNEIILHDQELSHQRLTAYCGETLSPSQYFYTGKETEFQVLVGHALPSVILFQVYFKPYGGLGLGFILSYDCLAVGVGTCTHFRDDPTTSH